ncbi:MAG TPA: dihydroorotase [Opitutae bacterium]|nr:dihydroorotase [Opitutae bacterium]|tara:strand:+ start:9316 stop:10656 length:1341 start_codon:yes stop_codon:yes gene_type:complete
MSDLLVSGGKVVNEGRSDELDLLVRNGRIERIAPGITPTSSSCEVIDASGKLILPGLIDDQVHFREPGLTHKACIKTESRAAVAGGVTTFFEMPNVSPPTLDMERLEKKCAVAARDSIANYAFFLGASNENLEVVKSADPARIAGIKVFMGSSTGNMLVDEEEILEKIFRFAPAPIATHCEHTPTIIKNERSAMEKHGYEVPFSEHPVIRSREACLRSSSLAVELAGRENARLHVLHVTTAEELDLFQPGDERITAEACVHHLWFEESSYEKLGSLIKCNPAIKTADDRSAIRQAVADGRISVLATDHAPHTLKEKQGTYFEAPAGLPLVQHSLPLMLEMTKQGSFSLETVVERACHAPARIFDVRERGFIREGYWADLVIVDPEKDTVVDDCELYSRCNWSPFQGTSFSHYIEATIVSGQVAFSGNKPRNGQTGMRVEFSTERRY